MADARFPRVRVIDGRIYATFYGDGSEYGMEEDAWRRLRDRLNEVLPAALSPSPPAPGGVVRHITAMTYIPNPDEKWGLALVSFSDGTLWERCYGNGKWTNIEGPPA